MHPRLLEYYNRELRYVRELGAEFAREYPKIAGRLGLEEFECADPYVERLLEGFAFLAARIELKMDAAFPEFTEQLLQMVYPHYLSQTPSMLVAQLEPDLKQGSLDEGVRVPRNSVLRSIPGRNQQTACEYRTAHDVVLWPLELAGVSYSGYLADVSAPRARHTRPFKSALRLRLRAADGRKIQQLALDRLPLFVRGHDATAFQLYELLLSSSVGLLLRDPADSFQEFVEQPLAPLGFEDDQALLPYGPRSFQGYRLLQEYFAFPSRFMFAELAGLARGVRRCQGSELELLILCDRHVPALENAVSDAQLALFCTPAVNLFARRADRIHLSDREYEYHIVPDRTRPADFEVYSVSEVVGYGTSNETRREFLPFFACSERGGAELEPAYYTVHRRPRSSASRMQQQGPRSSYLGSELFIALVDGNQGPYHPSLRQLAVETLCTNRDLPFFLALGTGRTDFSLSSGAPVAAVRALAGPSPPRPGLSWGETTWRLISQLSLNHLSLTDSEGQGAQALRELLLLYGDLAEPSTRHRIEGLKSVSQASVVRRLPLPGPPSFARGLEITLTLDEAFFEGASAFLLGAVLERFFAKYVSLNTFTETVLRTLQRGEITRWKARLGRRNII